MSEEVELDEFGRVVPRTQRDTRLDRSHSRSRSRSPSNERSHKRRAVQSHNETHTSPVINAVRVDTYNDSDEKAVRSGDHRPIIRIGDSAALTKYHDSYRERDRRYYNNDRHSHRYSNGRDHTRNELRHNDTVMTYKEFILTLPDTVNAEDALKQYNEYTDTYNTNKLKAFYELHRTDDWLVERYDIVTVAQQYKQLQNSYQQRCEQTCSDINNNTCINLDVDIEPIDNITYPENSLYISSIRSNVTRTQLLQFVSVTPDSVPHLFITDPLQRLNSESTSIMRSAVAVYKSKQLVQDAYKQLQTRQLNDEKLRIQPCHRLHIKHTAPNITLQPQRIEHDLQQSLQLIQQLDKERHIIDNKLYDNHQPILADSLGTSLRQLNGALMYLRLVHHTCYYCAKVFNDYEHMFNECGLLHARNQHPSDDTTVDDKFASELDTAIQQRLNGPTPAEQERIAELNNVLKQSELNNSNEITTKIYHDNITEVEAEKYSCLLCNKMFKGRNFVERHIANKHTDVIERAQQATRTDAIYQSFSNDMIQRDLVKLLPLPRSMQHTVLNDRSSYPARNARKRSRSPVRHRNDSHYDRNERATRPYDRRVTYPQSHAPPLDVPATRRPLRSYADIDTIQSDAFVPNYDINKPVGGFGLFKPIDIKKTKAKLQTSQPTTESTDTNDNNTSTELDNVTTEQTVE